VIARRLAPLVLAAGLLATIAACGIPSDESPRVINAEALPPELNPNATTTTVLCGAGQACEARDFFYVTTDQLSQTPRLVVQSRDVPAVPENQVILTVLRALLARPDGTDIGTRIPENVELISADLNDAGTLTLTFSSELRDVTDEGLRLAAAQIVFTASELPGVEAVQFNIVDEGGETSTGIPDQDGNSKQIVTTADYNTYAPN
jgi:spore germination protein GerM